MSVSFCLPHHVAVSAFIICSGLCACIEMLYQAHFLTGICRQKNVRTKINQFKQRQTAAA